MNGHMNSVQIEQLGRASRRAAALTGAGVVVVLLALTFAVTSLRRLEREGTELTAKNGQLREELAAGLLQRDSLRATLSQTRLALASTRAAINAFHAGRLEDAVVLYGEALAADPGNAYVQNLQAYALFRLKRLPQAVTAARKSIAADTTYAWGYFDLARILCAFGSDSLAAAKDAAARAVALRPEMRGIMTSDREFQRVCNSRIP
jgi:tetratricopeptide (TPR) repeat protein